jgi:hypothetical protein
MTLTIRKSPYLWAGGGAAVLTAVLATVSISEDDDRWLLGAWAALALTVLCLLPELRDRDHPWREERNRGRAYTVVAMALAAALVGIFVPFSQNQERAGVSRNETANKLKMLILACINYEAQTRHLPGPAILGADGQPLLSWRVAILPYIDEEALYKEFHLDEPWDSPHNLALLPRMPRYFEPDFGVDAEPFTTPYQVFVGPGTAFNGSKMKLGNIRNGASNTIAIAEASVTVPWTKPADLAYDPQGPLPPLGQVPRLRNSRRWLYQHPEPTMFLVAMLDGSVLWLPRDVPDADLREAIEAQRRGSGRLQTVGR